MLIYTLALIFIIIPMSIRAYLSLKAGKLPLPKFQNNIVVSKIKLLSALGVFYHVIFWGCHVFFALWAMEVGAWGSVLAFVVYMVVNPMLLGQIKARGITVQPPAAPGDSSGS